MDGMGLGDNSKAAIIRIGLMEMKKYPTPPSKLYTSNPQSLGPAFKSPDGNEEVRP